MNILAIDDERLALAALVSAIKEADPQAVVSGFRASADALASLEKCMYDVAFLDIELRECTGMALVGELRRRCPALRVVFVTGYSQYALDAFALHADGYVMKPVSPERVREELDHVRQGFEVREAANAGASQPRVRIQCLGNFEVFVDGSPVRFGRSKTKELLAYLIDRRGAMCTNGELMAVLWESDNHEPYLRQLKKDLIDTMGAAGCADMLVRERGSIGVVVGNATCDYYDLLEGKSIDSYRGEYMEQYSWAEATKATLR